MTALHANNMAPEIRLTPGKLVESLDRLFVAADALFEAAQFKRSYTVAGQRFTVASDLGEYMQSVDRALATGPTKTGPGARIFVGVAGKNGCPRPTWAARHFEERKVDALLAQTPYRIYYYEPLSYYQIFDRKTSTGLQILQERGGFPAWDPGSPLRNFLQWHLASRGGALVHAGTLGIGDNGVLLAGSGGSGKSGTVLGGLLSGLTTVGDDYVFVRPDELTAFPLFETLKQDGAGLERVGISDHPAIPANTNWQGKFQFFLRDLAPAARVPCLLLKALLLPRIGGATMTSLEEISSKEAFLALAPSGVTQIPGDRPLIYATAAQISRRLPCYRLNLGRNPEEVSEVIRKLIEDL